MTVFPVLLLLLVTVTSQQELSFQDQLLRQQDIQLEQQDLQGQLQGLAIRIQSAKDLRNDERVTLLHGMRDSLLARMQDLQDQLHVLLHGTKPPKQQVEERQPPQQQATFTPQTQQMQQQTQLPQQVQQTQVVQQQEELQQQEEAFQQQEELQQKEEIEQLQKEIRQQEDIQQKEIQKPVPTVDDQLQSRQTNSQNRNPQVNSTTNLPENSSNTANNVNPQGRSRTMQNGQRNQQRNQFQHLQFFGGVNPFENQFPLTPQSIRRVFQFSGQVPQSFGQVPQLSDQVPQSFAQAFQSFGQPPLSFSQASQSFGQPSQSFGQPSQSFGQVPFLQEVTQIFEPQSPITTIEVIQQPVEIQVAVVPPPNTCITTQGAAGLCRPLVQCLTFYIDLSSLRKTPCRLGTDSDGSEQLGVCCPVQAPVEVQHSSPLDRRSQGVLLAPPPPQVPIPPFTFEQLANAANKALRRIERRNQTASFILSQGVFIPPLNKKPSPAGRHQEHFFALTPGGKTMNRGVQAQAGVEASVSLVEEFNLTPAQGLYALPRFSLLNTIIADTCPKRPDCPNLNAGLAALKYRTADASCNNLRNGEWGSASVALQRILPPKYGDGVNSPRIADGVRAAEASKGSDGLPSARVVSTQFAGASNPISDSSQEFTLLLMQWGQFLDHDLTHSPISKGNDGGGISCCRNGKALPPSSNLRHPDCYPIIIPKGDPYYSAFKEECMEFVRSLPAPRPQCNFGPREQMNQITGYLDASNVYGSSLDSQRSLRLLTGGRLKIQPSNPPDKGLLPGQPSICTDDEDQKACFAAGDGRANEQPELAVMHTLWVREHNRIAGALSTMHPHWSDEAIFQESRRIVAAEMQHITYNEFLPIILGNDYMKKFELLPLVISGGNQTRLYDADLNAGITNAFAAAAFRFGHSLVQGEILGFNKFGSVKQNLKISKNEFFPFSLYEPGAIDDFVRGLSTQTCQRFDRLFTAELTNHLFQGDLPFGLDLISLNLQRGRDHGLAPYADWREVCGAKKPTKWEHLLDVMDRETIEILRGIYTSVSEIDLFVGAVGERGGLGGSSALLGPTLVCIIGDQFARLRRGDRFFYEEGRQPSSFTKPQLEQLRKASLARILCDNSDDVAVMQPLAFIKASYLNQRVSCSSKSIPQVDLGAWAAEVPAA